jgi:hypothetical protein
MTFLIELAILAVFLILALTQVVFPLFGWKRFFWIFRDPEKRLSKIEAEIEEIKLNKTVDEQEKIKQTMEKGEEANDNKKDNLG